jgi:hypothetical protein
MTLPRSQRERGYTTRRVLAHLANRGLSVHVVDDQNIFAVQHGFAKRKRNRIYPRFGATNVDGKDAVLADSETGPCLTWSRCPRPHGCSRTPARFKTS